MSNEEWRPIAEFPGYEVSDFGRAYRLAADMIEEDEC